MLHIYGIAIVIIISIFFWRYKTSRDNKLGYTYKSKLGLKNHEVRILNQLDTTILDKNFSRISFCTEDTLKLYLNVINDLSETMRDSIPTPLVIDQCIYTIKKAYDFKYNPQIDRTLDDPVGRQIQDAIDKNKTVLRILSITEEKKLFKYDSERWKKRYEELINNFDYKKPEEFYSKICNLVILNEDGRITARREMYYKAHQFLADKNKEFSLKTYFHYLSIQGIKHREINKRNQAHLFQTKEQQAAFEKTVEQFKIHYSLEKAFNSLAKIYTPQRKKIKLNQHAIEEAKSKQYDVAKILGEYLTDEDETVKNDISANVIYEHETIEERNRNELFDLFVICSFRLPDEKMNKFSQLKGIFKDGFIASINDHYYEQLDDLLIEIEDDEYILNKDYFELIKNSAE